MRTGRLYFLLAACLSSILCFGPAWAGNLLENPGFEKLSAEGLPEGWIRDAGDWAKPFSVASDAARGRNAVCLETASWIAATHQQYLLQKVGVSGAKALTVSARAKGRGSLVFKFKFFRGAQLLKLSNADETVIDFFLTSDYLPYSTTIEVPQGADSVEFRLGNVITGRGALNIWGRLVVDEVALAPVEQATPQPSLAEKRGETLMDVAPLARIRQVMPGLRPEALVDGDPETANMPYLGVPRVPQIRFDFPAPLQLRLIRLYVRPGTDAYLIRGHRDGDGRYETILAHVPEKATTGWVAHEIDTTVRGLCLIPLAGRLVGYRTAWPWLSDVQIYALQQGLDAAAFDSWRSVKPAETPARKAAFHTQPTEMTFPEAAPERILRRIIVDFWMLGLQTDKQIEMFLKDPEHYPPLLLTLGQIKTMGANSVEIFFEGSGANFRVPWPSKVSQGMQVNALKPVVDVMHQHGLKVGTRLLHCIIPYELEKFHYPHEETSRYPDMKQYENIPFGNYYKTTWMGLLREMMACGLDGISIAPDEYYYKGHLLPHVPEDCPSRAAFKKRFGYDSPPPAEGDTEMNRKWIVLNYEGIADLCGTFSREIKQEFPGAFTRLNPLGNYNVPMTEGGIAPDLLGQRGGLDYGGYCRTAGAACDTKYDVAAFGRGKVSGGVSIYGREPDSEIMGGVILSVMHGAGAVCHYRHNYIMIAKREATVRRGFEMVRDLDRLGILEAQPPDRIAVLIGRASADWWQLRAWYGERQDPSFDRGVQGLRGTWANEVINRLLLEEGYPYQLYYLEQLSPETDLSKHRVILLPFPYAMSDAQAAVIRKAAEAGARILAFERQGEADEWGNVRQSPALSDLFARGAANVFFSENLFDWGVDDQFQVKVLSTLDTALGDERPLVFRRYGKQVETAMVRKGGGRETFIAVVNHERDPVQVDLGVRLSDARYEVFVRSPQGWARGGNPLNAAQLADFRVDLVPQEVKVLYIRRMEK